MKCEVLMDTGTVLIAEIGAEETREFLACDPIEYTESENDRIRVVTVRALDGKRCGSCSVITFSVFQPFLNIYLKM